MRRCARPDAHRAGIHRRLRHKSGVTSSFSQRISGHTAAHKDVQYSSRIASHIVRQQQAHRLRHVINQLAARLPEAERNDPAIRELTGYGCQTRMHVVRLLAPQLERESHTKDIDFSPAGIMQRWDAGHAHTKSVLERTPWVGEFDPLSGVILHEQEETMPQAAE